MKRTGDVFILGPVSIEQFHGFLGASGNKPDTAFVQVSAEFGRNVQVAGITGSDHQHIRPTFHDIHNIVRRQSMALPAPPIVLDRIADNFKIGAVSLPGDAHAAT